jgi:hypothetical protein
MVYTISISQPNDLKEIDTMNNTSTKNDLIIIMVCTISTQLSSQLFLQQ